MKMMSYIFLLCVLNLLNKITALENGLALTPPMGWLQWERFRCLIDCDAYPDECISEKLFIDQANRMVEDGYREAGYEYIIIDDCWASKTRDNESRLQADPDRFPSGIKALADYVHNLGLKLGIYADYGTLTCGGYPGSIDHLELDAQTFADWGVDYLKLDGCYADTDGMEEGYGKMSKYLNQTGRPIVFSCSFTAYKGLKANYSAAVEYCNLWRNYGDIDDSWEDVKDIADWFSKNQKFLTQYAGPGHWNDPDMLIIGNFGLSLEQSKSQMTIWSLLAAPLIMSVDLRTIEPEFRNILQNQDAIRINQDPLGTPGVLHSSNNSINIWTRPVSGKNGSSVAIGLVSYRTDGYKYLETIKLSNFGLNSTNTYTIKNVFDSDSSLENRKFNSTEDISFRIAPSGSVLLLVSPVKNDTKPLHNFED